jgi:PHD/YefM family antitoxin component YafN of YafNO toxin-antitoxin module
MIPHHPDFRLALPDAAARLAEVVDQVTGHPGEAIVVSQEAGERSAVIVDAEHYRLALAKAQTLDRLNGHPLPHGGLVVTLVDDDEFDARLAARRKEQTLLAAAKLATL